MEKSVSSRWGKALCRSAALAGAIAYGGSGLFGQAVAGPTPSPGSAGGETPQNLEAFIVTGSYLPTSAVSPASPVTTLDRSQIEQSGATDALRLLKNLAPVFTGNLNVGNEWVNGAYGESAVGLRNLPTLVLLNGRRSVNSPYSSAVNMATLPNVDLNTIPLSMIERVEILKDSASTLYGSDAIGGVINIILRKEYKGAEAGVRFGTDGGHDYQTRQGWVTAGASVGTASIIVGAQYFENEALTNRQRPLTTLSTTQLAALGQNVGLLPSYFNATYAGRVGSAIIAGSPLAAGAPGYNPAIKSLPAKSSPAAAPLTLTELQALGYYIPITDTPISQSAAGSVQILNTTLYDTGVISAGRRSNLVVAGEKAFARAGLTAFGEVFYSQSSASAGLLSPSPITGISAWNLTIPANNPYNLFGVPIGVGGAANAPGVRTRLDELGNRYVDILIETYRGVLGLRGRAGEKWEWESALSYSRAAGEAFFGAAGNGAVMNRLLIPQLNNAGGYVYDSQGRPLSVYVDPKTGRNLPVYDMFAVSGVNAPESIEAVRTTLLRAIQVEQPSFDMRATGRPFMLPGGELAVAIGAEIRREQVATHLDAVSNAGFALGFPSSTDQPAVRRSTRAAFVESLIPVTAAKQGVPLLHRLDVTAAVRYERLSPGGDAVSPKFGVRLMPFDQQLVVRGTYSRGFIAPSLFALYGPPNANSPNLVILEGNGQTGSGGATGRTVTGQFVPVATEQSNPSLEAAKSESFTGGWVFSPKAVKGLSLWTDYYHIRQGKVGGFDYSFIASDLNARGSNSVYAANFRFADGSMLTSSAPNQVTSTNFGRITAMYNPVGDQWTDGLDLGVAYDVRLESQATVKVGVDANVPFNFKARTSPIGQYYQYARNFTDATVGRGTYQGVIPNYALKAHVDYTLHNLGLQVRASHLPALNAPGTAFGAPPGTVNLQRADGKAYTIPSYTTADITVSYRLPDGGRKAFRGIAVGAGVNNVFDRDPPFVPGGGGGGGTEGNTAKYAYDIIGRYFFVELKKSF